MTRGDLPNRSWLSNGPHGRPYYRARYYDPQGGRFVGEDPIGFRAGVDFYSYVMNNPVNFVDPTGNDPNTVIANFMENWGQTGRFLMFWETDTGREFDTETNLYYYAPDTTMPFRCSESARELP